MNVGELRKLMTQHQIPYSAVAHLSGAPGPMLSLYLRELADLSPAMKDRVVLTLLAMIRKQKQAGVPIRWSRPHELRQAIEEGVIELRAERSAELRRKFEESLLADAPGPDVCELLGLDDSNCSCG